MQTRPEVAPGTLAIYTDVVCAWSTITLHRLRQARADAGLDDDLAFDLRLYLLEEINGFTGRARRPTPDARRHRDAVQGSPHLFLADGSDVHHPDADFRWAGGEEGKGFPVVTRNEPEACAEVVRRAAAATAAV